MARLGVLVPVVTAASVVTTGPVVTLVPLVVSVPLLSGPIRASISRVAAAVHGGPGAIRRAPRPRPRPVASTISRVAAPVSRRGCCVSPAVVATGVGVVPSLRAVGAAAATRVAHLDLFSLLLVARLLSSRGGCVASIRVELLGGAVHLNFVVETSRNTATVK